MTYQTPCSDPKNDPNDWFIARDGRQYTDVAVLTHAELQKVADGALHKLGDDHPDLFDLMEEAMDNATGDRVAENLVARRHAKDACFTECYFRNQCLEQALDEGHAFGTWGGYYEEEIREIRREIARRNRKKL